MICQKTWLYGRLVSSTGRRPASICHGLLSIVRLAGRTSVCALTFSLNIFFSETTCRILMKFYRNVPAMVPLQNFLKKFDSVKNSGCHGNKTEKKNENFENLLVRNHKG